MALEIELPLKHPQPPSRGQYASTPIRARRQRIARAARELIVERGLGELKMCDVADLAGVSEKTLYNISGSRNELISHAVQEYQDELQVLTVSYQILDLDQALNSVELVCRKMLAEPQWGQAMVSLFFSPTTTRETYEFLHAVSTAHIRACLDFYRKKDKIDPAAPVSMIMQTIANGGYAIMSDWSNGRIMEEEMIGGAKYMLLTGLRALVSPDVREVVDERLRDVAMILERCDR